MFRFDSLDCPDDIQSPRCVCRGSHDSSTEWNDVPVEHSGSRDDDVAAM
jgi:hypothetical protein